MKLFFVNLSAPRFTAATPDQAPLGGSESSLCYLARNLAVRGHDISIAANLPEGQSGLIAGIKHYPLSVITDTRFFAEQNFTTIIICNAPAAAAPLKAASPKSHILLWAHVLPDQPSMQVLKDMKTRSSIDATIFVSKWQQNEIARVFGTFERSFVIGNGIAPAFMNMFGSAADLLAKKQNRAAYAATPYRGLSVLLRAMEGLDRPTKLYLYSSMKLYQADDTEYQGLFARAGQNPLIENHGVITQSGLAGHFRETAFYFYPSIYPETFCITLAEAMAAGLHIVAAELGALPQTAMGYADFVPVASSDGQKLVESFRPAMRRAIDSFTEDPSAWAERRFAGIEAVNRTYSWAKRADEWEEMLGSLS